MKKPWKIVRNILVGLITLLLLLILALLIFYNVNYKETPVPSSAFSGILIPDRLPDHPILLPIPKKVDWKNGQFTLASKPTFQAPSEDQAAIAQMLQIRLDNPGKQTSGGTFFFKRDKALKSQAYQLSVTPNLIRVTYGDLAGAYYALGTVRQLALQTDAHLPCVEIADAPDLETRGAMLDISRGKVPTLETLYQMVDFLTDVKYNQLQLYIEGFSFAYPSFRAFWEKTETPLTPEEVQQLDKYCKERFIELVPNQNSLGHMSAWLSTETYKDLAECPKGYNFLGLINMKSTMNPKDPRSLELVKKMSEDLLPNFTSEQFNVDLDEPFELGKNKAHPINDPREICKVYLDYVGQLHEYVKSKGKKMMMWGDVISRNPEFIDQIPKDITLLEWRYESAQDFGPICKKYQEAGLNYMVCPGTSSWTSFTGRTDNMLGNVENAVSSAIRFGAKGMLITDWGDTPHLQYLTASFAGLAYGAALSWNNVPESKIAMPLYLSYMVFKDSTRKMGGIILQLGRYNQFEEYPMVAGTVTGMAYRFGIMDKAIPAAFMGKFQTAIKELMPAGEDMTALMDKIQHPDVYNADAMIQFVDTLRTLMHTTRMIIPQYQLVLDEYDNSIRMISLGARIKKYNNYHLQQTRDENRKLLSEMKTLCDEIIPRHEKLWMSRNKKAGCTQSLESIKTIQTQVQEQLTLLDKNFITRWYARTKEKVITAAAVLYLR